MIDVFIAVCFLVTLVVLCGACVIASIIVTEGVANLLDFLTSWDGDSDR